MPVSDVLVYPWREPFVRGYDTPVDLAAPEDIHQMLARSIWRAERAGVNCGSMGQRWGVVIMRNKTKLIAFGTVLAALVVVALLVLSEDPGDVRAPGSPLRQASESLVAEGAQAEEATVQESRPETDVVTREKMSVTETTGSLLVTVRWSEGNPAPGIAVALRTATRGLPYGYFEREVSDDQGQIRLDDLPAGSFSLRADRGGSLDVEVVAGRRDEHDFVLPEGIEVTGVVTDRQDQPVAGAGVWLQTEYPDWAAGGIVARTAGDGSFALEGIPTGLSLGAVAPGYAPSVLIDLDLVDTSSPPVTVQLVLENGAGVVEGRVVSDAGMPITGALIAVGKGPRSMDIRGRDQWIESWTHRTTPVMKTGASPWPGSRPVLRRWPCGPRVSATGAPR